MSGGKKFKRCESGGTSISDLPDEILSSIMSYCTVRDAVNTSNLSKGWRRVSFSNAVLNFTLGSMFQEVSDIECHCVEDSCADYKERFIRGVNQFIKNHEGTRLTSLRVEFCLWRDDAREIDRWVTSAASLGAEQIILLFSCYRNHNYNWKVYLKKLYIFRFELLYQAEAPKLEYLALRMCALGPGRIKQFSCLKKLSLTKIPLGSSEVESIVSCFTNLEHWTMINCILPDELQIPSSLQQLKFLSVTRCCGVKDIDVSATGLTSFEYFGESVQVSLSSVLKLRKVYFGSYGPVEETYHFQPWANFPSVETLSFFTADLWVGKLPECMTAFTNLKELEFFCKKDAVLNSPQIIVILQSFPLLEKIHLGSVCHRLCAKRTKLLPIPEPFQPIHKNLKEIHIGSSIINRRYIELVVSLLDYASSLDRMVLDVQRKAYLGAGCWDKYNEQMAFTKAQRAKILLRLRDHPKSSVVEVQVG